MQEALVIRSLEIGSKSGTGLYNENQIVKRRFNYAEKTIFLTVHSVLAHPGVDSVNGRTGTRCPTDYASTCAANFVSDDGLHPYSAALE